jgi:hypothetical protein
MLLIVALSITSLGVWMSTFSYEAASRIFQVFR